MLGGLMKWKAPSVSVVDPTPTSSYLDEALFTKLAGSKKRTGRSLESLFMDNFDGRAAKHVLLELAQQGIVRVERGLCGMKKFPTIDRTPEAELKASLREVLLDDVEPDSFMMCLIALLEHTDANLFSSRLTKPHFEPADYANAKPVLQKIAQRVRSCWVEEEECEMVSLAAQDANM